MSDTGSVPAARHRRRRIALLVLVVFAFLARRYLAELSPRLLPLSRRGLGGFMRYACGDYVGAAAAYGQNLREAFATAGLSVKNEEVALLAGDRQGARTLATNALARDPGAHSSLLTLAEISLDDGATDEAVQWVQRALVVAPTEIDGLLLAAVIHSRAGDYARATRMMTLALRDWRPEGRPTTFIRVLGETGRLYTLPAEGRPNCLLAHLHRYLRIYDGHQAGLAIARAEDAIATGDQVDDAYVNLGVVRQKQTKDAEALTAFLHAIEANPRNPEAYRWASVVYADRGDLANEYRMSRAAYEFEPKDPAYALPLAGVLAERLGDYRGALEIMTGVLASGMETPALLDRIGYLHGLLGQIDDAIRFYQRAAALDPRDPTHLRGLGWVLSVQGHEEEAIQALQHALTLNPWVSETRFQLAIVYRKAGHYDEAIPEYERVYREEPSRRTYLPDLCITYHLAARFESARECAVQYLRMAPTSPDMQFLRSFSLAGALDGVGQ